MTRVLALLLAAAAVSAHAPQDWDGADAATIRLRPAAFRGLPDAIRADLERRQCTIPQTPFEPQPANVISGRFISATSRDWAVLCSRNRTSRILVFRGGSTRVVDELGAAEDRTFLQVIADGVPGFSRALGPADAAFIRRHHDPRTGVQLPALDHDGINDMFIEKGSVVWFWNSRQWLQLQGADAPGASAARAGR